MAVTLHELGVLYSKMARSAEAERSLGTALAIKRSLAKRDGRRGAGEIGALEGATVFRSVAASLHQLGVLAMTARPPRYKQAATRLQEALKLEGMHGGYTSSVRTAATRTQLGKIALRRGNLDEAEKQLKAALATLQKTYKSELHVNVASARHQLGLVAQLKLKWDDAAFHFQQALRIRQKVYASPCNIEVAFTLRELGRLERARGDLKAAEAYFQEHSGVIGRILENPKLTPAKITRVSKEAIACKYALRSLLREQKRTEDVKNCSEEIMDFKRRVAKAERTSEDMRKAAIISPCASQSLLAALRLRERLRTTILSCQANSIHLDLSWLKGDIDQVRTLARREDGGDHEVILAAINTIAKEMEEVKGTEDNYDIDTKALLLACDAIRGEARNRGIKVVDKVLKKKR
uniref:MalT-like TPR region domain-containing protein n=1 Tax=Amorphochlora amoebiformis TaxID=1561963 RepID=A0A7S0DS65_9EUKA